MARFEVLIADDDLDDFVTLADAFAEVNSGVCCSCVLDGRHLLKALEDRLAAGERLPDLVVLDLNMPRMNGAEALRRISFSRGLRHIPVIVYTTTTDTGQMHECFRHGACSFASKGNSYSMVLRFASEVVRFLTEREISTGMKFTAVDKLQLTK